LRAQLEAKELNRNAGEISGGGWDTWVSQYLERHCESPRTLERYTDSWEWVAFWLQEKHYHSPRAITYRNALEYIEWRTNYKKKTGKTVGRNSATPESLTSVRSAWAGAIKWIGSLFIIVGIVLAMAASYIGMAICLLIGFLIGGLSSAHPVRKNRVFSIVLKTASGDVNAYTTADSHQVQKIVQALNDSIISQG
ncbi:MAG: DUF6232 family protein, partial [Limisphaerales bacterium]